jgi:hypothetical protein
MSYRKVCSVIAAVTVALALAGGAYGDPGKNGPPGPAGNPNQPTSQPQANAPQGPTGNSRASATAKSGTRGKSTAAHAKTKSHGKSKASHGNSVAAHAKTGSGSHSTQSHANTTPGTPRKGGREDRPAGKITICHATKSVKNPYVEITISLNGLHGHGPADDPRHHDGSWKDIIPAPAGGCPSTVQQRSSQQHGRSLQQGSDQQQPTPTSTTTAATSNSRLAAPEVTTPAPATAAQEVLGARAAGGSAPASETDTSTRGESKVLGARASGTAPAAALAARPSASRGGTLPFTGTDLAFVLLVAVVALLGGVALRRATASGHARA